MEVNELEYNTRLKRMPLPEYGRNIQRMVDFAMTIEDRDERTRCAQSIIRIMGNLFPHLRDVNDFKNKLWDHLAIMSDFKLDIDFPCLIVEPDNLASHPEKVPYSNQPIKVRHYGHLVEDLIKKALEMEDGPEKDYLIQMIANHMKKSFLLMNHEVVEDKKVFDDLRLLSNGKIDIPEDAFHLVEARDITPFNNNNNNKKSQKNNRRK